MEFYDDPVKVDEYESMCEEYDGSELYNVLARHLVDGLTLLELGCGPGNDINFFHKKYTVTGSDLSDEFILRSKKKYHYIDWKSQYQYMILRQFTKKTLVCEIRIYI